MSPIRSGGFARPTARMRCLAAPLLAVQIALAAAVAGAQEAPPPPCLEQARQIIGDARRIVTPDGIERLQKVRIGGIDQWVSIRGADRRNPVLLLLHGGPGYMSMPMSWWYSRGWEEYFTVVQWDQRGSGKTWLINDQADVLRTLTGERLIADTEEMVAWVRRELGKDKIFVVGHSFGSYTGLQVALRHPAWLHAFVGVTQLIDGPESERRGWHFAMDAARRDGNAQAVHELEAIAPYGEDGRAIPIEDIRTQRKWVGYYGGVVAWRRDNDAENHLARLSPDYSDEELRHIFDGNNAVTPVLFPGVMTLDFSSTRKLAVPLVLFEGRHDFNVNSQVAAAWFDKVEAPEKHLVWFEHSGHMPMIEEPGKFLVSLVRVVRPLAERAGDVAP
jgi:pimeloyl-ACP methyl ester carboxylesterase